MDEFKSFPLVTFLLSIICLTVFLFTNQNIVFYERLFGFIPSSPKIYTLITYSFIHVDIVHLLGNLLILIVAGLAIEEFFGKFIFLTIYIVSANIAVIFDIIGRLMFKISFNSPFVGASGAIFGLVGAMLLVKPFEKIPTFLVVLFAVPLFLLVYESNFIPSYPIVVMAALVLVGVGIGIIFYALPGMSSIVVFALYSIFTLILIYTSGPSNVSYLGHLGGVIGGFISFFIFAKGSESKSFKSS